MIRRYFFLSAAGAAASRIVRAQNSPNETVRVAVVGCGGRGASHVGAWTSRPNVELAGLVDVDDEHEERAAYVVLGSVECDGEPFETGQMLVFQPGSKAQLLASTNATVMLVGGAKLDGTRYIDWNFVSSSKARIERAKDDWRNRRFPPIPGDDEEFIALPEG